MKNIRASRKKLTASNVKFLQSLGFVVISEISEMVDVLNIGDEPIFDDCIVKFEFHTYNPYINTFGHSDEI